MIIPEIELRQIAMEMFFAAMLIRPPHPALEHAEIVFDRVGMNIAARPLELGMVDGVMGGEPLLFAYRMLTGLIILRVYERKNHITH